MILMMHAMMNGAMHGMRHSSMMYGLGWNSRLWIIYVTGFYSADTDDYGAA